MCSICGCGIDAGNPDGMFSKEFKCLDCGHIF
jgi:transposase